jgi:hypothetical protein
VIVLRRPKSDVGHEPAGGAAWIIGRGGRGSTEGAAERRKLDRVTAFLLPETRERASPADVRAFLARCRPQDFLHADIVLPLLERDSREECRIHVGRSLPVVQLRTTYRIRAKWLAEREVDTSRYPATLARDVAMLADALDAARDQTVLIWDVELPDGTCFGLFELEEEQRLAGCVRSNDQRVIGLRHGGR